jgi:DNA-binding transcriptional LysR family regulator
VHIELRHLRTVIAVADSGGISAAAAQMNVEASAVSRTVHELEDWLGVSLFERHARGVRATTAGGAYVVQARDVLARLSQAEQDARLAARGVTGKLALGFVWSFTGGPVVGLLQAYSGAYPKVALRLVEDGNDDLVLRLRNGELDAALTATDPPPLPRLKPIEALQSMPLWLEPLFAALPEATPRETVTWDDLSGIDLLCRPGDDWPRFSRYVQSLGGPKLRFVEQNVAVSSLFGLVAAGVGWLILPSCASKIGTPGVRVVPIVSEGASLQVEVLWRPQTDNPALTRFLALLRQMYSTEAPRFAADVASRSPDRSP